MENEKIIEITSANLIAWDQVAPIHRKHNQDRLLEDFKKPGHMELDDIDIDCLNHLEVQGKDVAQICCNNGIGLLSVKNMGAARCVGFDGAPSFIAQAKEIATAGNIEAEFICTDVYEIGPEHHQQFDIVLITIGVFGWMPELPRFFGVLAGLLKPGGTLLIHEQHPILDMIDPGEENEPVNWTLSYFNKEPYTESAGLDYYGGTSYETEPLVSFTHTMWEIMMAGIDSGLLVTYLEELPDHISNTWYNVESADLGLPMSYVMMFDKPPAAATD